MKKVLHVGPGKNGKLGPGFREGEWQEIRYDLDPATRPDILGDMRDMRAVSSGSMDAVYTTHTLEHLYPLEVKKTLEEYARVLAPEGFLVLGVPDLQAAAQEIAEGRLLEPVYQSTEGPISAIDIVYGWRGYWALPDRHGFMIHKTGFTLPVLKQCAVLSGFMSVFGTRHAARYEIWIVGLRCPISEDDLRILALDHFPE